MGERGRLIEILKAELRLHPGLAAADLEKLVYQATFGGDHLLRDPARFEQDLRAEWDRLPVASGINTEPALQLIDPSLRTARLHLRPCRALGIEVEDLAAALSSQPLKNGTQARFERLWSLVLEVARAGEIDLPTQASPLQAPAGSPGHHTAGYGRAAYRLVNDLTDPSTAAWVERILAAR
jgi:hypothetical protein